MLFSFSRRELLLSLLGAMLFCLMLMALGSRKMTLRPAVNDHISNISSTIWFYYLGPRLWNHSPLDDATAQEVPSKYYSEKYDFPMDGRIHLRGRDSIVHPEPLLFVWPWLPRPYPPGMLLVYAPFAGVAELIGRIDYAILFGLSFFFVFLGHLVFCQCRRLLFRAQVGLFYWPLLFFIYAEVISWTLSGQYDPAAILFLLPALENWREQRFFKGFSFFCISCFFHFRSLFFLVVPAWAVFEIGLSRIGSEWIKLETKLKLVVTGSFLLALLSAVCFLIIFKSVRSETTINNPLFLFYLHKNWGSLIWVFLLGLALTFGLLIKAKDNWGIVCAIWMTIFFSQMAFTRSWYILFLVPCLVILPSRPSSYLLWGRVAIVLLMSGSFFGHSPFEFWYVKEILNHLTGV